MFRRFLPLVVFTVLAGLLFLVVPAEARDYYPYKAEISSSETVSGTLSVQNANSFAPQAGDGVIMGYPTIDGDGITRYPTMTTAMKGEPFEGFALISPWRTAQYFLVVSSDLGTQFELSDCRYKSFDGSVWDEEFLPIGCEALQGEGSVWDLQDNSALWFEFEITVIANYQPRWSLVSFHGIPADNPLDDRISDTRIDFPMQFLPITRNR